MKSRFLLIMLSAFCLLCFVSVCFAQPKAEIENKREQVLQQSTAANPRAVVLFIENRTKNVPNDRAETLRVSVANILSEKGFRILDYADVLATFNERSAPEAEQAILTYITQIVEAKKTEASIEDIVNKGSSQRLAQMMGADLMLIATILSYNHNTKHLKAYGVNRAVNTFTLRMSLKIASTVDGGSTFGTMVKVSDKVTNSENIVGSANDMLDSLIETGARKLVHQVEQNLSREIQRRPADLVQMVEVHIKTNVENATVSIDGVVQGSVPGTVRVVPGVHRVEITKERFVSWKKPVNMFAGQELRVTLEHSREGLERDAETKRLAQEVKESEAEIYSTKLNAEGSKEFMKNSSFDGDTEVLIIGK